MTSQKRHTYIPYILLIVFLLLSVSSGAQRARRNRDRATATDSTKIGAAFTIDSISGDTIFLDTIARKKKEPLDAPVEYEAKDSVVFTQGGFATLYGDGKVNYDKIELTCGAVVHYSNR